MDEIDVKISRLNEIKMDHQQHISAYKAKLEAAQKAVWEKEVEHGYFLALKQEGSAALVSQEINNLAQTLKEIRAQDSTRERQKAVSLIDQMIRNLEEDR